MFYEVVNWDCFSLNYLSFGSYKMKLVRNSENSENRDSYYFTPVNARYVRLLCPQQLCQLLFHNDFFPVHDVDTLW